MMSASQRGFALPLVLWAIAISAFSLVVLMEAGRFRLDAVREESDRLAAEIAAETALARVAYLLATQPIGPRGIEPQRRFDDGDAGDIRRDGRVAPARPVANFVRGRTRDTESLILDGRPYLAVEQAGRGPAAMVQVQDEAGLVNLASVDEAAVARLLVVFGQDRRSADALSARLFDYADEDDLVRISGADGRDYRAAGLPPPRNRPLDSPEQAFAALGWTDALDAAARRAFANQTTVLSRRASFNPNTATPEALQAIFALEESSAQKVIATREENFLLSVDDVAAVSGSPSVNVFVAPRPSRHHRVKVTVFSSTPQESYVYVARLSITQDQIDGPILRTPLETPVRARSGERTGSERDGQFGVESVIPRLPSP